MAFGLLNHLKYFSNGDIPFPSDFFVARNTDINGESIRCTWIVHKVVQEAGLLG
jgi:hypothetical protein